MSSQTVDTPLGNSENSADSTVASGFGVVAPEQATVWNHIGFWFPHIVLVAYSGVIGAAFFFQLAQGEMPCPLCILQRMAMILVCIAALWMIGMTRKGTLDVSSYFRCYGLMLVSAMLGGFIAFRQVELHILPGDLGYGDPILGLHMYTWSLITFLVVTAFVGVMLIFGKTFQPAQLSTGSALIWLSRILVWLFLFILIANVLSITLEEGFNWVLPDDPIRYELPHQLGILHD